MAGETRLADLCEAIVDCPHSTPAWTDSGVIVLRNQNIRNGRLELSDASFTDEKHYIERTRRASPAEGDLVITREAPMGEVCMIPANLRCCLGQRMVLLRPNRERIVPRYLLYALQSSEVQHEIRVNEGTGSTVSNLRIPLLESLPIPTVPIADQRGIAHVLGTLDDKIELNRRINETLEAIACALFKSWFVDFDPVRAKAEGRDTGLPKHIADLFPDSFESSELGEVPKQWEVTQLGALVDTVKGRSYKSEELVESDTALVTLKSFARGGGYRPDGLKSFSGTYKPEQVVTPGELVIACTDVTQAAEVIGRPAIVRGTGRYRRLVASLDTLIVRPRESSMTRAFLYFLGGTESFVAHTYAHTTGTTVLHLAKNAVPSFKFIWPPKLLVQRFDALASPALVRIQALEEESGTLSALRDALLPKLISGELSVKDAAEFVRSLIA